MSSHPETESGSNNGITPALQLPSLFPDIQWLRLALHADTLLLADNTTFSRKSRSHRGKIRTPAGSQWIHIPLLPNDRTRPLASARIDQRSDWLTPLWRALEFNYRNSIYFELYEPEVLELYQNLRKVDTFRQGCDLVLKKIQAWLEIKLPPVIWLSGEELTENPLKKFVAKNSRILIEADSKNYLTPVPGGVYPNNDLPPYRQHFGGFEANCCWLDVLFERGPESWEYLDLLKSES